MEPQAPGLLDREQCEHRLALDPADAVALQHRAVHAWQQGDGLGAVRRFRRAGRLLGDRAWGERQAGVVLPAALSQVSAWIDAGRFEEAGAALQWLADGGTASQDLFRLLGTVRLIQGRDGEAHRLAPASGPDTGFLTALAAVAKHRPEASVLGTVVIPAHGAEATIEAALDSVAAAVRHYNAMADAQARFHICVVDDASPDGTAAAVLRWGRAHPGQGLTLISTNRNAGAGAARNRGTAAAVGELLWFLDADDAFLERHLLLTVHALRSCPEAGYVRTGILFDAIDDTITPEWRAASENSYPCNLCVRRACHDLSGGFPDEAPFRPAVADDVAYARALQGLFAGVKLEEKTVRYTMRPGNALFRQKERLTGAGGSTGGESADPRFMAIEILTRRRVHALEAVRARPWDGPPLLPSPTGAAPPPAGGPQGADALLALADRFTREGRHADAAATLGAALGAFPRDRRLRGALGRAWLLAGQPDSAAAALRPATATDDGCGEAWFETGVAAHRAGNAALAVEAFRAAARLRPDLAPAWFNLGALLIDAAPPEEAAAPLRAALALQPDHANALLLLGRLAGQASRPATARRRLGRALRLDPQRADLREEYAAALLAEGDAGGAVRHGRAAVLAGPDRYGAHAAVAAGCEALGDPDGALAAWTRAIRCNQGFGEAFTRRSVLLLARQWGAPAIRPSAARPGRRITSTALGRNGRFGNQLLQYGFLRLYAARHDLDLEVPPWPGRHLYDLDDPLPGVPLPPVSEATADLVGSLTGESPTVYAGHDISGYFCGDTGRLARFRDAFRACFEPGRNLRPHADGAVSRLRGAGHTVVALHLRRGDFGWGRFWTAPEDWYLRWLETVWGGLDRPVLYLATDSAACAQAFAAYRPLTARDLADPVPGAEFFTDFHVLSRADFVGISNSTFSFVATMLNQGLRASVRPDRGRQALVAYDPWNAPVLL
ncbi:MAG TPA: glycosyltransferase [Azospirillaceae bacterium]|nr:glycosyltransferase [Azospirillaceae bacterium]